MGMNTYYHQTRFPGPPPIARLEALLWLLHLCVNMSEVTPGRISQQMFYQGPSDGDQLTGKNGKTRFGMK